MNISYKISAFFRSILCLIPILCLILSLVFFWSCSRPLNFSEGTPCSVRLEMISREFERERYVDVREPLNKYAITCASQDKLDYAYYLLAESYYLLEDWSLAELEYQSLLDNFPNTKYREEVTYKKAQSLFNQKLSWDRDQEIVYFSLQANQFFLAEYPASDYVLKVRNNILELRKILAKRVLEIARIYQHFGKNLSAIVYYKSYLEEFIDLADEAKIYYNIAQCYVEIQQFTQAEEYLSLAELKKLASSLIESLQDDIKKYRKEEQIKKDKEVQKQYFEKL